MCLTQIFLVPSSCPPQHWPRGAEALTSRFFPPYFLWQMALKKIAFICALDPEPACNSSNVSLTKVQWKVEKEGIVF